MIISAAIQRIKQRKIISALGQLRQSQFWSRERIREFQLAKIIALVEHAYANVPYYQKTMKDIGAVPSDIKTFEDFARLPVLTKDIIKGNFDSMIASNMPAEALVLNSTGGSTGTPLKFYQDRKYELWADAARIRGWYEIAGCSLGDSCAVLWGAVRDIKTDFSATERLKIYLTSGEIQLNAFNLRDERKLSFLRLCRIARPKLLRGYFTAVKDLAYFLHDNRIKFPPLDGVILCAETVNEKDQAFIEKVFGAPSYNTYGGRELSLIAMECGKKNGLHEISENNYVEYEPVELAGCTDAGNLIITNLNNYAMPFIRYRIGDIGVPSAKTSCECGRGLPIISRVIGRSTEVFVFRDGTRIAGEMFIHLMKDFPIKEYQFVQTSQTRVVLRIKKSDNVPGSLFNSIRHVYAKCLPTDVELAFEEVEGFKTSSTGKFMFVFRQDQAKT